MVGGGNGKEMYLTCILWKTVTFEHDTLSLALFLGWKICLSPDHTPVIPVVESVFPRQLSCRQYVQREVQPGKPSIASAISAVLKPSIASTIPESVPSHFLL
jgi:hypothetical protein